MSNQPADIEAARRLNGQFGIQPHTESGIIPMAEAAYNGNGERTPMTYVCSQCPTQVTVLAVDVDAAIAWLAENGWGTLSEPIDCPDCNARNHTIQAVCDCGRTFSTDDRMPGEICTVCAVKLLRDSVNRAKAARATAEAGPSPITDPNGCAVCGRSPLLHHGTHDWTRPSDQVVKDRIQARRAVRPDPAPVGRAIAPQDWTAHRLCPVGNGTEHAPHAFYVGVDDMGDDIGTVTCNGWAEPADTDLTGVMRILNSLAAAARDGNQAGYQAALLQARAARITDDQITDSYTYGRRGLGGAAFTRDGQDDTGR